MHFASTEILLNLLNETRLYFLLKTVQNASILE